MLNHRLKIATTGIVGAVGLGIGLLGAPEAAYAGKLRAGFDFWVTPEDGGTIDLPDIVIPANFFFDGSDSLTINAVTVSLDGHPTGTMGEEQEQEAIVCFDQHGNAVSGDSEHVVQCVPDPNDPTPTETQLEMTDTIVERLTNSTQLSEVGDMAIIPIRMKSVSLVGSGDTDNCIPEQGCFEVTTGGIDPVLYYLKARESQTEEQLTGNLKLTVDEVLKMDGMTIINGTPSIGLNESCSLDPDAPNFDPNCLGLPVTFELAFKNAETEELTDTFFSDTIFLEDGTQPGNEEDVFFTFKKTPEPSTTLGLIAVGIGGLFGVKRKKGEK